MFKNGCRIGHFPLNALVNQVPKHFAHLRYSSCLAQVLENDPDDGFVVKEKAFNELSRFGEFSEPTVIVHSQSFCYQRAHTKKKKAVVFALVVAEVNSRM
jgi:hypothetical protein